MSSAAMSFRHRWVLAMGKDNAVGATARLLGVMAVNEFGKPEEGGAFWPSHESLGDLIGKSERTAERGMKELVEAGWLVKSPGKGGATNRYVPAMKGDHPDKSDGVLTDTFDGVQEQPDRPDGVLADRFDGFNPTDLSGEHTHRTSPPEQIHSLSNPVSAVGIASAETTGHRCDVWCHIRGSACHDSEVCVECAKENAPSFED